MNTILTTNPTPTSSVTNPRIGGVIGAEVLTGWYNDPFRRRTRPNTLYSRLPTDFQLASIIEEAFTKGLVEEKRIRVEGNPVSLTSCLGIICTIIEDYRMDMMFHVWSPTEKMELYLLYDWGYSTKKMALQWVNYLTVIGIRSPV